MATTANTAPTSNQVREAGASLPPSCTSRTAARDRNTTAATIAIVGVETRRVLGEPGMPRGRIAHQLAHGCAEGLSVGAFGQLLVLAPRMQLGIEQRGLIDRLRDEGFLEERCARDPIESQ